MEKTNEPILRKLYYGHTDTPEFIGPKLGDQKKKQSGGKAKPQFTELP